MEVNEKKQAKVSEILARKNIQGLSFIPPAYTVYDCALKMNDENISAVLIKEGEKILGLVTERDITRRVVLDRWVPDQTTVDKIMSPFLVSVSEECSLEECTEKMKKNHIRHLLVKNAQDEFYNLISERDILQYFLDS